MTLILKELSGGEEGKNDWEKIDEGEDTVNSTHSPFLSCFCIKKLLNPPHCPFSLSKSSFTHACGPYSPKARLSSAVVFGPGSKQGRNVRRIGSVVPLYSIAATGFSLVLGVSMSASGLKAKQAY